MESTTRIKHIIEKIQRLAGLIQQLRNENAQLKEQVANQMNRISVLEQELDHKQEEWNAREKTRAVHSEQLKKQIDLYIDEIDRCIAWLQNE